MCLHYAAGIYLWIYDNVTPDQIKIKFNERWVFQSFQNIWKFVADDNVEMLLGGLYDNW